MLRELLCLLPSWEGLAAEAGAFMGASLQAAEAVAGTGPAGGPTLTRVLGYWNQGFMYAWSHLRGQVCAVQKACA